MRTPLERMIDQACGVPPGRKGETILLRCPDCGRERQSGREEGDPPGPVYELRCPGCWKPKKDATASRGGATE